MSSSHGGSMSMSMSMSHDSDLLSAADICAADDAPNSRSRWRVSVHETNVLEAVFASSPRPNKNTIHQLATMLSVKPRQVQVWFQNRRQRWRKDFIELERARTMHLAELSGKVIDFHGDLLPLHNAANGEHGGVSMPAGWERLLLAPGAAGEAGEAGENAASSSPSPAAALPALTAATVAAVAAAAASSAMPPPMPLSLSVESRSSFESAKKDTIDELDEIDLCDILNFAPPPAAVAAAIADKTKQHFFAGAGKPAPPLPERETSGVALSLNGDSPHHKSQETEADHDETLWLGMEWLIADSDDIAVN